ncbi:MAG TPA: hypothetical protein VGP02_18080 [Mycobacteriales bacterium]|nr:hypothetical protein [Mycobacteriales bacterium]
MPQLTAVRRPWRIWVTVAVLVAVLCVYFVLLGQRGVLLVRSDEVVAKLLGAGLLVLPFLGAWLMFAELRFGVAADRLAGSLDPAAAAEDVPRLPSGRVDRKAAVAVFERRRAEVEAAPGDWQAWYRLGLAYDDAGDRRRARAAVRRAVELHRTSAR